MINKITTEIDKTISSGKDYPELRKLILEVISNDQNLPPKFVRMCYDLHEADTDTEIDEEVAKSNNLHTLDWFIVFLKKIKEENIEFWN